MAVRAKLQKNWKDSSGIVLLSGAFKYARPPTPLSTLGKLGENPLIVPLDETDGGEKEWEVALVKRSSKSGFFGETALSLASLCVSFPYLAPSQQLCVPRRSSGRGRQLPRMAPSLPPLVW